MKPSLEILIANKHKFEKHLGPCGGFCRLWEGAKDRNGYGEFQFRHEGRKYKEYAHVARFLLFGGVLKEGQVLRHSCDVPACVTISHLLPGSHADNVADRVARGRSATGLRNGRAKLSPSDIKKIQSSKASTTALANVFGVDRAAIRYHRNKTT